MKKWIKRQEQNVNKALDQADKGEPVTFRHGKLHGQITSSQKKDNSTDIVQQDNTASTSEVISHSPEVSKTMNWKQLQDKLKTEHGIETDSSDQLLEILCEVYNLHETHAGIYNQLVSSIYAEGNQDYQPFYNSFVQMLDQKEETPEEVVNQNADEKKEAIEEDFNFDSAISQNVDSKSEAAETMSWEEFRQNLGSLNITVKNVDELAVYIIHNMNFDRKLTDHLATAHESEDYTLVHKAFIEYLFPAESADPAETNPLLEPAGEPCSFFADSNAE